ncbi:GNAT family N-acetyltransferase [Nonomuraea sp. NPDC050328]|uniref:GNAT family N-acetyltransferase n=1 Tax=Nonomuraea sp. NPDC050328 TaxID=3364361 RepID=UPI00378D9252
MAKPEISGFELVAVDPTGHVAALLDVELDHDQATIDTIAVHPDHQRRGLATRLLTEARTRLAAHGITTLDAWTRDDPPALTWYRSRGFTEDSHYLHVYANYYTDPAEPIRAIATPRPPLRPITAFLHAPLTEEPALREQFARVHVCRRFSLTV